MGTAPVIEMRGLDEVDLHFDAERARLLRRRFLWLCAVSSVIIFFASLPAVLRVAETSGKELAGALISLIGDWIILGVHVGAFVYAWRTLPRTGVFLRLAFWLFVGGTIFNCIYARVSVELDVVGWFDTDAIAPAQAWLYLAPFFMLSHLLTSLFMPWSLRESLVPGAIALAALAGIISIDIALGRVGRWAWVSLLASTLTILPGALICWWRFSRLRQSVEHRYFSKAYHALRHELATARRVHESLLPRQRREGKVQLSYVYEPMREIGGDLLFVPSFPGGARDADARLNAVLLDVTGHGIAAALTVNRIVGELERLFAERPDASPAEILSALNRYVRLTLSHHTVFATALAVRVDAERGVLEYASGGHPPAFLRHGDGTLRELDSTAPLLGVVEDDAFDGQTLSVPFHEGDALLGFTDGANEARSPEGKDLGIAGMRGLFEEVVRRGKAPPWQWPHVLLDEVRAHREGAAEDDTLLMLLTRPRGV